MDRKECLDAATKCVCGERDQQYGHPLTNFTKIAEFWTTYKGVKFSAVDVAMMMSLLKIARIAGNAPTFDSFIDLAGYAACGCEMFSKSNDGTTSTIKI